MGVYTDSVSTGVLLLWGIITMSVDFNSATVVYKMDIIICRTKMYNYSL